MAAWDGRSRSPTVSSSSRRKTWSRQRPTRTVFKLAPYVVLMGTFATFVIIPFGPDLVAREPRPRHLLPAGRLVALDPRRADGRMVVGNKYSLIGGLRAGRPADRLRVAARAGRRCGVAVQAGTLSLNGIVEAQASDELFGAQHGSPAVYRS